MEHPRTHTRYTEHDLVVDVISVAAVIVAVITLWFLLGIL